MEELPIIQKTYDFIKWYIPILNRIPKNHRYTLSDRIINNLYDLLENLIQARYDRQNRVNKLKAINTQLDLLRYQTRLLFDFDLISGQRYQNISQKINEIGIELGSWLKQQQK